MSRGNGPVSRATLIVLAVTAAALLAAAGAAAGGARVEVNHGGLVSARFDAVPAVEALRAIRDATGLDVVVPASVEGRRLTLAVEGIPLEALLRRVLAALELGGYALVYEPGGTAQRVIVVDRGAAGPAPTAAAPAPERDSSLAAAGAPAVGAPAPLPAIPPPPSPPVHEPPAARFTPTGIGFVPAGSYDRLVLTVAGPDGLLLRREFPSGGPTFFEARDPSGNPLPDGHYKYELRVAPALPPSVREAMQAVRDSPDDRARLEAQLRQTGWLPRTDQARSGSFAIADGLIVPPTRARGGGADQ